MIKKYNQAITVPRHKTISKVVDKTFLFVVSAFTIYKQKGTKYILEQIAEENNVKLIIRDYNPENKTLGTATSYTNNIILYLTSDWFLNTYVFFHELAHLHLHCNCVTGASLPMNIKEKEADIYAAFMMNQLFPGNKEKIRDLFDHNFTLSNN